MNRSLIILICSLITITVASANFAIYIDDDGPASDTMLAISTINEAVQINPMIVETLPEGEFALLLSEYDEPSETMLFISHGEVWLSTEQENTLASALGASLRAQGVLYTLTEGFPSDLEGHAARTAEHDPDFGVILAPEPETCTPDDETTTYCDDGSVLEACRCFEGALVCEENECPESAEEPAEQSPEPHEPERPGFFARIADFLFGWMRR